MKKMFLLLLFFCVANIQAQANKDDVKKFVEISGLSGKYDELIEKVSKQVSASKQEHFKKDLFYFKDKMINEMVNFYASKFSQNEINAFIDFYASPLGKKLIASNLEFNESTSIKEQEFQREIGRLIMKYMN